MGGAETVEFIKKKVSSVVPEFYVAWIIAFVVDHIFDHKLSNVVMDASKGIFDLLFLRMAGLYCYSPNTVSWYLSAMFIAMAIIYPVLRRHTELYLKVISPLGFVLLAGVFCHTYESLASWNDWMGIACSGLVRGILLVLGGSCCWTLSNWMKGWKLSGAQRGFVTVIEMVVFLIVLGAMAILEGGITDFGLLFLFFVLVVISTSGQSYSSEWFNNKFVYWLGEISLSVYLGHTFWKSLYIIDMKLVESIGYGATFGLYVGTVAVTAVGIWGIGKVVRKIRA